MALTAIAAAIPSVVSAGRSIYRSFTSDDPGAGRSFVSADDPFKQNVHLKVDPMRLQRAMENAPASELTALQSEYRRVTGGKYPTDADHMWDHIGHRNGPQDHAFNDRLHEFVRAWADATSGHAVLSPASVAESGVPQSGSIEDRIGGILERVLGPTAERAAGAAGREAGTSVRGGLDPTTLALIIGGFIIARRLL